MFVVYIYLGYRFSLLSFNLLCVIFVGENTTKDEPLFVTCCECSVGPSKYYFGIPKYIYKHRWLLDLVVSLYFVYPTTN